MGVKERFVLQENMKRNKMFEKFWTLLMVNLEIVRGSYYYHPGGNGKAKSQGPLYPEQEPQSVNEGFPEDLEYLPDQFYIISNTIRPQPKLCGTRNPIDKWQTEFEVWDLENRVEPDGTGTWFNSDSGFWMSPFDGFYQICVSARIAKWSRANMYLVRKNAATNANETIGGFGSECTAWCDWSTHSQCALTYLNFQDEIGVVFENSSPSDCFETQEREYTTFSIHLLGGFA